MEPRVLSIQSHVVRGFVGNCSASFPLQLAGFEVDRLNTVQLSAHTGYPCVSGQRLSQAEVETLIAGLRTNGLLASYTHVLTGYTSSAAAVEAIAAAVREIRASNPHLRYVCDPVLGDHGRLYVPEALVPAYREHLLPLASLLTPNQFEAETLTGVRIHDRASAHRALDALHALGARTVAVTSSDLPLGQRDSMLLLVSCPWDEVAETAGRPPLFGGASGSSSSSPAADSASASARPSHARFGLSIPRLPSSFTGTGDLVAALLLLHSTLHPRDMPLACEKTVATVHAVCRRTMAYNEAARAAVGLPPTSSADESSSFAGEEEEEEGAGRSSASAGGPGEGAAATASTAPLLTPQAVAALRAAVDAARAEAAKAAEKAGAAAAAGTADAEALAASAARLATIANGAPALNELRLLQSTAAPAPPDGRSFLFPCNPRSPLHDCRRHGLLLAPLDDDGGEEGGEVLPDLEPREGLRGQRGDVGRLDQLQGLRLPLVPEPEVLALALREHGPEDQVLGGVRGAREGHLDLRGAGRWGREGGGEGV
jgi:pyridoxine kinase